MMKMLGSGRTVTDAGVNLHQPGHLQRALHLSQDTKKEAPLVPSGGTCLDLKREYSCTVTLKMSPPSYQLKSPILHWCFSSLFLLYSSPSSGLLPAQSDLTWCDGSSQPGKRLRGTLLDSSPPPSRVVPDSGSLSEGHRDHWDTQWVPFTVTWHRGLALDTDPWLC